MFYKQEYVSNVSVEVIILDKIGCSCMLEKNQMNIGKMHKILFSQVNTSRPTVSKVWHTVVAGVPTITSIF